MEYNELVANVIIHDVKRAYETHTKEDIKAALDSVKKIKNGNGDLNMDVVRIIRENGLSLVWNKNKQDTSIECKLAVMYRGMAIEIGQ